MTPEHTYFTFYLLSLLVMICFTSRASTCTWLRRWLRIEAETTWMPEEWQRWGLGHSLIRTHTCSCKLIHTVPEFRSMRLWWRGWTGTHPRCRHRTRHRKPSKWKCGRSTSSGKKVTHYAQKTRLSSQKEVICDATRGRSFALQSWIKPLKLCY